MPTHQQHPLRRLISYASEFRVRIVLATLCTIINKIFDLAPPLLIGMTIDVLVERENSVIAGWGITDTFNQVLAMAGLTLVAHLGESLFEYWYNLLWRNLAQSLQHEARIDAYSHVQNLEMAFYEEQSTGGLMAILNDDVNQLERFLDNGANRIIQLFVTLIVAGGYFIYAIPSVAWMVTLPMPFIIWGSFRFQTRLAPRYAEVREKAGLINGQLSNNLGGVATIKSFATEAYEVELITGLSEDYRQANSNTIRLSASFVPLIRMGIMAGFIFIMIFGSRLVIDGTLAVGIYSTLIYMSQRILWPLTSLGETLDLYQRAMASITRLFNLLDTEPTIVSGETALATAEGEVRFESVNFAYSNGQPIINDLTLKIPAGQTVAFVGATGSGKTTLTKLLLRFYDVTGGRVTVDGIDVRDLDLQALHRAIGLVSQEVYMFHGSARTNVEYGSPDSAEEDVYEAARIGEAHDFITKLPDGYDTVIGERGMKLSGGQRQRLSIARAVLKDPPILILDEATSAVDNETEAAIQRSMEKIAVGRTTIIIAHRLSTVRNADCIYVLENGQISESGKHDELVAENGTYAELWRIQTGERTS